MMTARTQAFDQAAAVLPPKLRRSVLALPEGWREGAEELRLRAGRPMTVLVDGGERLINETEPVGEADLRTVLEIASQASAHTVLERVRHGFVTVRGGHRIGLCGTAVVENGEVANLRWMSSMNIRIARQVVGASSEVLPELLAGGRVASTLILAPPGAGKTTLLRDLIRALSAGECGPPLRVGVADERGELAAMREGIPELDVGPGTDVMDGCAKAVGLGMLLRGMNPQVLAVDEITDPADAEAAMQVVGCGVSLLATAHGESLKDLYLRDIYRTMIERSVFEKLVTVKRDQTGRRTVKVEDLT